MIMVAAVVASYVGGMDRWWCWWREIGGAKFEYTVPLGRLGFVQLRSIIILTTPIIFEMEAPDGKINAHLF